MNLNENIKRILIFMLLSLTLICKAKAEERFLWYSPREVIANADKLQPGDILVLSKKPTPRSMWGHVAVLNEHKKIVEFPTYSTGYSESPLYAWQNLERKIAILRLKGIDNKFKSALFKEIDETITKPYGLTFNKNFDKRLYCSQFIYLIFKRAGEKVGRDVNLDSNGGGWVMPFDILDSPLLDNISIY